MAIEEQVIQPDSVNPAEQPVADTPSQPQAPDLSSVKAEYEAKLAAARKEAAELQEKFKGIKLQAKLFDNNDLRKIKIYAYDSYKIFKREILT